MSDRQSPLIALTRPDGGNARLAAQIMAQCPACRVIDWPLLAIETAPHAAEMRLQMAAIAEGDWLIFVSPRAVRFAQALMPLAQLSARYWAAVGQATATALQDCLGVDPPEIIMPDTTQDSEGLLAALSRIRLAGQRVWIVRGETGRETLADGLRARGASVRYLPVYRRRCATVPCAGGAADLVLPSIWVITAPESLKCLSDWAKQMLDAGRREGLLHSGLVVINERTEAKARALGFSGPIVQAAAPDDRALAQACSDRSLFQAG